MNRRDFGKAALAVSVAGPALLSIDAARLRLSCKHQCRLNEAENVLSVVASDAPWLSTSKPQLQLSKRGGRVQGVGLYRSH